jgi:uncharacterized membrane protein
MTRESRLPWLSLWDLLPLLTGLGLAMALPWLMKGLPDPIPTHFDAHGHPNGWTPQAVFPWICFGLPAIVWLVLLGTGAAFAGTDQDPEGKKGAAMAPLRSLTASGLLLLMAALLFIPRFGFRPFWAVLAGFIGLMILGTVFMIRDLKRGLPKLEDPDVYRWGLFYVNAADPRLWVPKRLGLGWTLNFAHNLSWIILVLLTLPPLILVGLVMTHR